MRYLNAKNKENDTHIVRLLNTFVFENHFCLVFEYLGGGTISIPQNNSEQERLHMLRKVACQLLTALMYLREMGVIHADLKPENIIGLTGNPIGDMQVFCTCLFTYYRLYFQLIRTN